MDNPRYSMSSQVPGYDENTYHPGEEVEPTDPQELADLIDWSNWPEDLTGPAVEVDAQ